MFERFTKRFIGIGFNYSLVELISVIFVKKNGRYGESFQKPPNSKWRDTIIYQSDFTVPLAIVTGMRQSELLALKWSDLD
jgi:integrase